MQASPSSRKALEQLDQQREAIAQKRNRIFLWLVAGPLATFIGSAFWTENIGIAISLLTVATFFSYLIYDLKVADPYEQLKHKARSILVADFMETQHPNIDYVFYPRAKNGQLIIEQSDLITADIYEEEDVLEGAYDEIRFYLSEVHLKRKTKNSSVTKFKGILFEITVPGQSYPEAQIQSHRGLLKWMFGNFVKHQKYNFWYDTADPIEFKEKMYPLFPFIKYLNNRQGDIRIKTKGEKITVLLAFDMDFLDSPEPNLDTSFQVKKYHENIARQLNTLLFIVESFAQYKTTEEIEETLELKAIEYSEKHRDETNDQT